MATARTRRSNTTASSSQPAQVPNGKGAVARRAYELYLARGCAHGHDVEDWLTAERELLGASQGAPAQAAAAAGGAGVAEASSRGRGVAGSRSRKSKAGA